KRIPIIGSIRVASGEGRLTEDIARYKQAGFSGVLLRKECMSGYYRTTSPNTPQLAVTTTTKFDLDLVSKFWAACIGDLKSTRSKTFGFRSKNNMEKPAYSAWAKL